MINFIPGTTIKYTEQARESAFSLISPVLEATGGLTLSQLSKLTGLEGSTIQNWIKRGWVAHPENKRYRENHLARIIILNMLRSSFQLEKIAVILRYVNGSADDRADDIIPDGALYTHLCVAIDRVLMENITDTDGVRGCVDACLADYAEPYGGAREKLVTALTVMTLAYLASEIKRKAETLYAADIQ